MKVKIEIDTRTFVRFWLVVLAFVLVGLAVYSARTALFIILLSFFLALALSPYVNKIVSILPGKSRGLSTAIAYLTVILVLSAIIFLVVPPIVEHMIKFSQTVPALLDSASQNYGGLGALADKYGLQDQYNQIIVSIQDSISQFAGTLGSGLVTGIGSAISVVTAGFLILVLTFLMLVEGPTWINRFWGLYKDKNKMRHHRVIAGQMYDVVSSFVVGQLSVAAIAGTFSGLLVFVLSLIFGLPSSLAIPAATISFVMSLIPMFGAVIGGIIITLILLLNNLTAAIIFIILLVIYQQIEANIISPKIQSRHVKLPALVILISVTIGVYLFGILGGIISIPIAGCINVLFMNWSNNNKEQHKQQDPQQKIATSKKKAIE